MKLRLIYCLLIFSVLLCILTSCDSDPVTPPPAGNYEFDSARFNWNIDTLPGWGYGRYSIYSPDSTDLFAINDVSDFMVRIKDGMQTVYPFSDFSPHFIWGLNSSEIYIGGGRNTGTIYLPHLKKWTGGSFIDIFIPTADSIEGVIGVGVINSNSDMWFANKKKLLRYDGGSFYSYPMPDTSRIPYELFLKDGTTPTIISNYLNEQIDTVFRNYIYELQGDTVIQTFQNTWYPGNPNYTWMRLAKSEIYGMREDMIFKFSFPYFHPHVAAPSPFNFSSGDMVAGNSTDDFIVFMYDYHLMVSDKLENMHHWNGTKFSYEGVGISLLSGGFKNMQRMSDNYFIGVVNDLFKSNKTYIFRGTRKK